MTKKKPVSGKPESPLTKVLIGVAIALIAGGSSPWWWKLVFPPTPAPPVVSVPSPVEPVAPVVPVPTPGPIPPGPTPPPPKPTSLPTKVTIKVWLPPDMQGATIFLDGQEVPTKSLPSFATFEAERSDKLVQVVVKLDGEPCEQRVRLDMNKEINPCQNRR
jgi:hypothetical protein